MIIYNKYIIFIFFFFLVLLSSCFNKKNNVGIIDLEKELYLERDSDIYEKTVNINTDLKINSNNSPNIILKTRDGDYKTEFYIKKFDNENSKNIFVINTYNDLMKIEEEYFHLPFLKNFSSEYFDKYYLVFVLAYFNGGFYIRNERIEQNNGKYIFTFEAWTRTEGKVIYLGCAYTALYVLEIPK
jgi:hypothetical protein